MQIVLSDEEVRELIVKHIKEKTGLKPQPPDDIGYQMVADQKTAEGEIVLYRSFDVYVQVED